MNILFDRQVWEQGEALKNVSDTALGGREIDSFACVEEDAAPESDSSRVWRGESGDAVEQRCLSGARRAEEDGESGRRLKVDIEGERLPVALGNCELE